MKPKDRFEKTLRFNAGKYDIEEKFNEQAQIYGWEKARSKRRLIGKASTSSVRVELDNGGWLSCRGKDFFIHMEDPARFCFDLGAGITRNKNKSNEMIDTEDFLQGDHEKATSFSIEEPLVFDRLTEVMNQNRFKPESVVLEIQCQGETYTYPVFKWGSDGHGRLELVVRA